MTYTKVNPAISCRRVRSWLSSSAPQRLSGNLALWQDYLTQRAQRAAEPTCQAAAAKLAQAQWQEAEQNGQRHPEQQPGPTHYIQRVCERMSEHPEEVAAMLATLNDPDAPARARDRAQILLTASAPNIVSCYQVVKTLGWTKPRIMRAIKRYLSAGLEGIYADAPRSGRPSKFTPNLMVRLLALQLFTPMQLLQQGLLSGWSQALARRYHWVDGVLAALLALTAPSVGTYQRRLNQAEDGLSYELCPNPDRDYVGNLLRVDLLRQFGTAMGYEVWLYDALTYTRDGKLSFAYNGKVPPETGDLMVLVQPHSGKIAATVGHPASSSELDDLIAQLLEAKPQTEPSSSEDIFAVPQGVSAIGARRRAEAQAAAAEIAQREAQLLAAQVAAGQAKHATRKAAEAAVEVLYADLIARAEAEAARAEAAALAFEDALDQHFSTLNEVIAREHKQQRLRKKNQQQLPVLSAAEQERERAKQAARQEALAAVRKVEQLKAKARAHAQAVGEQAVSDASYAHIETEYTEDVRIEDILPSYLAPEKLKVTGLGDKSRQLVIVVDALSPQAPLWEQARTRYPQLEIIFAPQLATGMSPPQQVFYRLESLTTNVTFYGLEQLEQLLRGQIAYYNLDFNRRPYPWELNALQLLNRRIYTAVWGQRNLKALDQIMLEFNDLKYESAQQAELKLDTWATYRHLRKVVTAQSAWGYEGLPLIDLEAKQALEARLSEGLAATPPFAHIPLSEREALGYSVAHPELLSAPVRAAYQSPQQARALLTLLKQRVPNQPYHPTLKELRES